LFYLFLLALPLSGWLASSAEGGAVSFFGVATLPQWNVGAGGEELFEEAHEVLGNILLVLVSLHVLAALKHHFVDKDDVLLRMLPASRTRGPSSGDRGSHAPQGTA
jgi:cytochrome b561